jgi:type I restriction enzyme S subunit
MKHKANSTDETTVTVSYVGANGRSPLQKDLPEGWVLKPIGEVCNFEKGKKPENTGHRSDTRRVPYINIKAFETGIPEEYAEPGSYPMCSKDDVLIVWDGARSGLAGSGVSGYIGSTLSKVWSHETDNKYLFYFLKSQYGYINTNTKGVGIPHVDPGILNAISIPLAPLDQQKLIVAEIEKQFSRLDEAVAALKRIQANLKRYKASVLKAAVEGKLTEQWRKEHPDVEPASELLKRILVEKRKKWEADHPGKKYKEPAPPDTLNLPELPKVWVWATWEMILAPEEGDFRRGPFGSALKKSIFVEAGYKVYEQYCPINNDPSFARYFITEEKYREMEQFSVKARDFLISCSGVTLGRITQIPNKYHPGIINQALLRVRLNNLVIDDAYFIILFRSPYFQQRIFDNSQGAAIPNVKGVNELKVIPLPLPPLDEQIVIARVVEEKQSIISELERQFDLNLKRAERLRQSILKKAFSGRLI